MSKQYIKWTEQADEFIRKNAGFVSDAEGARQLSAILVREVTVYQWRNRRVKLGLEKLRGRHTTKSNVVKDRTKAAIAAINQVNPQVNVGEKSEEAQVVEVQKPTFVPRETIAPVAVVDQTYVAPSESNGVNW